MSDAAGGEGLSKSAKKRAAKKARDAAHAEAEQEVAAPAPKAEAKAKGKAKAVAKEPEVKPDPKAQAKAKAKAEAAKTPEPEAKGKAKAKAKAEPEPQAPQSKSKAKAKAAAESELAAQPKAQGKQKAKKQATQEVAEEPKAPKETDFVNYVIDDGTGPAWEVSSGQNKKLEKRKQKADDQGKNGQGAGGAGAKAPINTVPGMGPSQLYNQASRPKGPSQTVAADIERILAMKATPEEKPKEEEQLANMSTATISVPEPKIGVCIGPKGSTIKMLTEKTGVSKIDTSGNLFTIMGPPAAVSQCEAAIKELIEKGYTSLAYEGFSENILNVHPSSFPDLIGKQGAIVRAMKEQLNVEINFQDVPKGSAPGKKGKVTLAGSAENVEKAKEVINDIVMYGHHELTHPGQTHEEMEVDSWAYRYIIGKAGSELRHIQHNWKVKVNIPRENSANDKVLIVGEPDPVSRAKAYIEKLLEKAENAAKGRDRADDKAADPWGDDEEEENWMKPYLYKR